MSVFPTDRCVTSGKLRFVTKARALMCGARMRAAQPVRAVPKLHAYRCSDCRDWHLTKMLAGVGGRR